MVYIQSVFMVFFLMFLSCGTLTENCWHGLTPLKSTRTDVEKLLGPSKKNIDLYETEKEKVTILYSDGFCKENKRNIWNVSKDTVLAITVIPKENIPVSSFINKFKQHFDKEVDYKIKGVFYYYNADRSVLLETKESSNGSEDIALIVYRPTRADDRFRCVSK